MGNGPILHSIQGDKFKLYEPVKIDVIGQKRIDEIFDGKVDLEYQLASYHAKSLILLYSYIEAKMGFK